MAVQLVCSGLAVISEHRLRTSEHHIYVLLVLYLSFDATEKSGKDGYVKEKQKSLRLCYAVERFEQSFLPLTETEFSDTQQNERQIATFYLTVRVYALCTLYTDPIF